MLKIYNYLKKTIDFVLYSNLWIAGGAFVLCLQTQYIITGKSEITNIPTFVFFATLLLYAAHRIIGIDKLRNASKPERYLIIYHYEWLLYVITIISAVFCLIFFFRLNHYIKIALIFPIAISLGYVIPFLPKGKRLRDLSYIKIFLVAIIWSLVTVVLPAFEHHVFKNLPTLLMVLERGCYIFALTIPFDIRDSSIDTTNEVKTLPIAIGIPFAKSLGYLLLIIMILLGWLNYRIDAYTLENWLGLSLSGIISAVLLFFATENRKDYYFSGLIDGMLLLQMPLMLLFHS